VIGGGTADSLDRIPGELPGPGPWTPGTLNPGSRPRHGRDGRHDLTMPAASASTPMRPTPPLAGWHWTEWCCEAAGTALLLLGGLSAVFLDLGPHSPVVPQLPSMSARLLLTGLMFAGSGSLIALSPLGRRSGAHLNPVVTLAFWTQGKVHPHDLAGYVAAQLIGALAGTAVLAAAWGPTAAALHLGATAPGRGLSTPAAAGIEAAMTAALVLLILLMTSDPRSARWTPLGTWILVAGLVWQVAPFTGTSLNPARSFGPAVLAPLLGPLWAYVVGPICGSLLATAVFALFRTRSTLTAKLFHDPSYPSTLGSELPVRPRRGARG